MLNNLAFWSGASLIVRLVAIGVLVYVIRVQLAQFQFKTSLQPLKRLLLGSLTMLIISNLPILYLHYLRLMNQPVSESVTAFTTFVNAVGMLLVALLLMLVYRFKGVD